MATYCGKRSVLSSDADLPLAEPDTAGQNSAQRVTSRDDVEPARLREIDCAIAVAGR
jgi:hypothetical protein